MYEYLDRRYALALYEVGEERDKAEDYLKELEEISNIIEVNEDFLEVIKHPHLSTSKKQEMFENIFKGKVDDDILSFLLILIEKGRLLSLKEIINEMKKIHLDRNKTVIAHIKTVVPLNDDERAELTTKLQKKYDRKIILDEELDISIIGGVYVRVGNDIIDGTIRSKFEDIRKLTLKTE